MPRIELQGQNLHSKIYTTVHIIFEKREEGGRVATVRDAIQVEVN